MGNINWYSDCTAVTPSDSTVLPAFRGLWVGAGGAVTITNLKGVQVSFAGVPAGTLLPVAGNQVRGTGTVASLIVALS